MLDNTDREISCTSVDNLIRQRLMGIPVSSNSTVGVTSDQSSLEVVLQREYGQQNQQSYKVKNSEE